ncbi:flavin monoamine oxidase family protein [Acidovorax sp.]|uniref:flavin monoamine oxidase family protein n=1 Tax=Acidovorax sp. TaxID=1872122 RepID=UPI00391F0295
MNGPAAAESRLFDAIVIGGGLAGLSSARRLKEAGASVVVLEARGRIGGRVHSQRLNTGQTIDLGAQFIGDSQRRISALVDEVGLTRVSPHTIGDNVFLMSPDAEPVLKRGDGLPLSLFGRLDALIAMWRLDRMLRSFRTNVERLDGLVASKFLREMTFTRQAADFLAAYTEGEMCASLHDFSAYELLDQLASTSGADGEKSSAQWYLAEGTEALAHHLAARLGDALVLNAPVTNIQRHGEWVTADSTTGVYRARHLIVAVPPQLYKDVGLLGLLTEKRRKVIAGYMHGKVIKTILVFESPWWRDLGASGRVLSPDSIFNSTIDSSPANGSVGILVLFSTAASAIHLGRMAAEGDRIAKAVAWLRTLSDRSIPEPIAARSIDWNADSYSLGGYASHRGMGSWGLVPDLFAPVHRVHFAGTETAAEWRSFMEGALQSAERAADEVLAEMALDGS